MTAEQDFDVRLRRWLDAREAPASTSRVSEEILAELVTVPQERRPLLRRVPTTRPPLRLLAVAAVLLLAGGLFAVIGLGSRPSTAIVPPPTPSSTPSTALNPYPQLVRQIDLGAETWQTLATPSNVWVQADDVGVQGIDPSTGLESGTVDGGSWMFTEGDELWVQKGAELVLVRVDPDTGRELERFEGIPGFTVAKDGDTIWGFDEAGDVVQVEMATGDVLGSVDVPDEPKQIVLTADSVWVACDAGNALVRIDPDTYEVVDTIDVGLGPVELELGFGSLWVRNRQLELVRVDPKDGSVLAKLNGFAMSPSLGLSFGGGFVWASRLTGMAAIDPESNEIVREISLPGAYFMDSYWLDDTLWVSTAAGKSVLQVDAAGP
jgi:streptogramin lyase